MNLRRLPMSFAALGVCLATVPTLSAHRLDEYLQATRVSIDVEHVDLEIDLTAGVAMASEVFAWIDTNQDREISKVEGDAYARQMLGAVTLSVDGRSVPITLVEAHFPQWSDMSLGVGTIRLRATAKVPSARAGRHEVSLLNMHRPEASVYLVNALVPANPVIRIADQRRDLAQHGLTLDYTISSAPSSAWSFAPFSGLVILGQLVFARRWFRRRRQRELAGAFTSL